MIQEIYVKDGYKIWSYKKMRAIIEKSIDNPKSMGRTYVGMYIEWYLHNIGYYLTLGLAARYPFVSRLNERFKHINLERR